MDFKKLLKVYRTVMLLGGVIVICLASFLFGVIPLAQKTYDLWTGMHAIQDDIKALTNKSQILQSLDEATLRNDAIVLTDAVPSTKSIATIFATLDGVSGNSVLVKDFTLTKPGSIATDSAQKLTADAAKIGASILPFSLSVTGPNDQVLDFLTRISSVRRIFTLRGADITFSGSGAQARANLSAYYSPLPKEIGGTVQTIVPLTSAEEASLTKITAIPLESSLTFAVGTPSAVTGGKTDPFSP